jgi:glycosyltransferase involved in cell wall biosynthesis
LIRTKLLIFTDWFTPAFKAGGPIRSIVNLVDRFKHQHQIYIYTSDRDLHDTVPFENILSDQWIEQDGYTIYYHSPGKMNYARVKTVLKELDPDKIYLNSMFSNMIYPLLAAARSGKVILAPRGMLRPSALAVKPIRKYLYLSLLRSLNIDQYITFHATSEEEKKDIKRIFPQAPKVTISPNLPCAVDDSVKPLHKNSGELNMVFVGRIHPIKNLIFLLQVLRQIKGQLHLDLVVATDDDTYWHECKIAIEELTSSVQVNIHLNHPHHLVKPILESAHLFILPTEGENFGHAIFESLAVGCPVLISDQTPWKDLQSKKAGVDLPINKELFAEAVQQFVDMDDQQWQEHRMGALALATDYEKHINADRAYGNLFQNAE